VARQAPTRPAYVGAITACAAPLAQQAWCDARKRQPVVEAEALPRYVRAPAGSMLDPLVALIYKVVGDDPEIKAPRVTETLRDEYGRPGRACGRALGPWA
jgi:hypothetical protein